MNKKSKDCVFALFLFPLGLYALYEGIQMVLRSFKPPYRVEAFRVSPGMLPVILAAALLVFGFLLFVSSLRGGDGPMRLFKSHLGTAFECFGKFLISADTKSMAVSVLIMWAYTFFALGETPFWLCSGLFLIVLMLFLRASKPWVIVVSSAASIAAILILFEGFFKTTLP